MLGENDGPSMIAYAADGAQFGVDVFAVVLPVLFAMAYVCQEMCMRVGAVTHRGYGELVLQRYGRAWGWFGAADLTLTNLVTLVAEFVAIRVGLAWFHLGAGIAVALGVALVLFTAAGGRYWRWERIVLGPGGLQRPVPDRRDRRRLPLALAAREREARRAAARLDDHRAVAPRLDGRRDRDAVDDLLPAERIGRQGNDARRPAPGPRRHGDRRRTRRVVRLGALVAGAVLASSSGAINGYSGAGFPAGVAHATGNLPGTLLALGLIEAGAVAILTISASTAYAAAECAGVAHSFNYTPRAAFTFHGANVGIALLAGLVVLIPGAPLLSIALNANVLATVLLPVTLVFVAAARQ